MMKIFQSYIARHFLVPFVAALSVFTGLLLLGNVFGHLYVFTKGEVSVLVFIKYILCQAPYFMVKIMPIATLLAVLAALGEIIKSGEWKAGMAGGWRPLDMLMPLVLCAAAAGLLQFAVQETAAPSLYLESEHIFRRDIRGRDDWARLVVNNVSFSAGEGRFVTCRVFDGRVNTMQQVVLSAYSGMKLGYTLQAEKAVWNAEKRRWDFNNAVETIYRETAIPSVKKYKKRETEVSVGPENLILENLVPDGINLAGLLDRIKKLRLVGAPSVTERTLFWCKVSAPFANIIMALIGASIALLFTRGRKNSLSYGIAIGIGFVFWAALVFSQEIGNAELMSPFMSGISPLVVFGIFSVWIMRRARVF